MKKQDDKTWRRHTVAVPSVTRTIDSWCKTADGPKRIVREEMVHAHDVYRRNVNGKVDDVLWHRGARVLCS
jgi:hypothetical protein